MAQKLTPLALSPARLAQWLARATMAQAARIVEQLAWRDGHRHEVGRDMVPAEEPIRFAASERLHLVAREVAEVDTAHKQVRIVANVLGLAGATPALPPAYSELQLQRRRARDYALSRFLNVFDHRALSFFYRITRKYRWPMLAERAAAGDSAHPGDPVREFLVTLSGLAVPGARDRLGIGDALLAPQAARLADQRRSARTVEAALRLLTGYPLRVIEAWPVWMAVPAIEQSRLGACHGFLGDAPAGAALRLGGAAMIGSAVLDVQHHYVIEIGPLTFEQLHRFCASAESRTIITRIAALAAGIEQRPVLRLLVAVAAIPALQLGSNRMGAMLGRTTWLGQPETTDGLARDCTIPITVAALA